MTGPAAGLRVAVDATPLLGARTGVGVFTAELLAGLPGAGVDAVAYATSWRGRHRLAEQVGPGVRVARRPQAARPLRAAWSRWDHPVIERWTGPVDVVHGPNYVVPPTRHAAALVTVHDLTFVHHPEMSTADTLAYPGLIRRAVRRGARVHTESRFVADEITAELGVPAERITVVPLGVTPPPAVDPADGHRLAGGPRYVLAVGTVEPRKDHPLLVDAFEHLADDDPDLRLVLAGPDGWGAVALDRRLDVARHRDRIVRLGWVDDLSRAALLRGATVLAFPSRYEGFGLPPLEAMAVGTPVVATAVGAVPEVVGDAAVLVAPGDAVALAGALAAALDDDELRARLVAAGHDRVERFRWSDCVTGLVALYGRLAAGEA
ncbi:MAG TPA: glycosyltransferase family 1 protein [Acidimicrobiales bacterium]|nr:glycosyltransferase family 1 protein [Acidimicrobiales bacterium]